MIKVKSDIDPRFVLMLTIQTFAPVAILIFFTDYDNDYDFFPSFIAKYLVIN